MSRMPGATWKPLAADWNSQPRMSAHDIFCIHTMVGGLDGTDSLFRVNNGPGYDGTESHFGVGGDGTKVQWQDIRYQADANYLGNGRVISSENADHGPQFPAWTGSDVPPLTPAQIEANAQILAWVSSPAAHADCPPTWICHREGIPLVLIPDSKPGRRGVAPHRWGVPGYVVVGGELWSTSRGKACPGDRRIAQIPQIILRARDIAAGNTDSPFSLMESEMQLVKTPDGKVYKVTDLDVSHEPNPYRLNAVAKARGLTDKDIIAVSYAELQDNVGDAADRRTRVLGTAGDVDEARIVEGLLPQITTALAGRTGATRDEIAELLHGITFRAS